MDGTGIVIVLGSELLIVEDMLKSINVYECTAANVIDGQPKIASGRVKFVATGKCHIMFTLLVVLAKPSNEVARRFLNIFTKVNKV